MKLRIWPYLFAVMLTFALGASVGSVPATYDVSITNVLKSEGGAAYTNNPKDPGGPTKYGVTLHDVRAYIDSNATAETVKRLTQPQAEEIYQNKYWLHRCVRGDLLPAGLDYSVFDYAVNAGVQRVGIVLRRLLGVNTDRCDVSEALAGIIRRKDPDKMIRALNAERRQFYANLIAARPASEVFRNGWMARANSVEHGSLKMAGIPVLGLFGEEMDVEPAFGPGKAYVR